MFHRVGAGTLRRGAQSPFPARGSVEAGLPDGPVEQAQRRRKLAEGGGCVLAAGAVQHPGEHLAPLDRPFGPTFGPLVKAWRATATGYSDDELRLLLDIQRKLEDIVRGQLGRLRGDLDQRAPSRG